MTDTPHRIHLRRPWMCRILHGRVSWSRRFGRPTGLSAGERVWLVAEDFPAGTLTALNGEPIPTGAIDVTDRLQARNKLTLTVPLPQAAADLTDDPPGRVVWEIRPTRLRQD